MNRPRIAVAAILIAATATGAGITLGGSIRLGFELPAARPVGESVAALWQASGPQAGAFASRNELGRPFDLYATAWALRLGSVYGLPPSGKLDASDLTATLRSTIDRPEAVPSIPTLEVIRRCVIALHDLGASIPTEAVATHLEALRAGGTFRFAQEQEPTAGALAAAVDVLLATGLPISQPVRDELDRAVDSMAYDAASLQHVADDIIPLWTAADGVLAAEQRAEHHDDLVRVLDGLWQALGRQVDWDGPTLALAAAASDVGKANGIAVPAVPATAWRSLERPDGLLQLAQGHPDIDLQTTFAAARLGRHVPNRLAETLAAHAGRRGWSFDVVAGPTATMMATMVLRRMRLDDHRDQIAAFSSEWQNALMDGMSDSAALRDRVRDLATYNAVAGQVGAPRWMPGDVAWSDVATWTSSDQQWLVRAFILSGKTVPSDGVAILAKAHARPIESVHDALGMYLTGNLIGAPDLRQRALDFVKSQEIGGLYLDREGAPYPDLRSTAIGYALTGRSSFEAARRFDTGRGFSVAPDLPDSSDAGTLQAAYLAVGLATGFDEMATIP